MAFKQGTSGAETSSMNNVEANDDLSIPNMPENDLQSLGFIVNNGRPRFKLDEPTMTGSTLGFTVVDEDDTLSFEILGKDSLHVIQELSHASYVDIQQKSKSVDYSSMVSALSSSQVQDKLTELLQENVQLKETLKQNNIAMKQQFNVLATWQEEVMKVHQSHKQKFAETRELIRHLKKECAELKLKISASQCSDADNQLKIIDVSNCNLPEIKNDKQSMVVLECSENESIKTAEASDMKQLLQNIQSYLILSDDRNSELKKALSTIQDQNVEIKKLKVSIGMNNDDISSNFSLLNKPSENTDIDTWTEKCLIKDEEMNHLKDRILLLVEKLQCDFTFLQRSTQDSVDDSVDSQQQFVQNVKQCEEKLQDLTDCFVTQISRFVHIEECVKECIDTLETCSVVNTTEQCKTVGEQNTVLSPGEIDSLKEKILIMRCQKKLADQRVKIITDRQNLVKAVNEFRRLFSEHNSILYELEIVQEENVKLKTIQDATRDSLERIAEFEVSRKEEMQSFEKERDTIAREKQIMLEEKKSIDSKRKMLEQERNSLENERQLLLQEQTNLQQEKVSLDQQSQLYEGYEKVLQSEKKLLAKRQEEFLTKTDLFERNSEIITTLRAQIADQLQDMEILRTQLSVYEEDFKQEKNNVDSLITEKLKLTEELQNQVEANNQSKQEIERLLALIGGCGQTRSQQQTPSTPRASGNTAQPTAYSCPKCQRSFTSVYLIEQHVERCLDLE